MNTLTATSARETLFPLLKKTLLSHLPTRIQTKTGNTILLSEEEYDSLIETAELLSIPGFKESIEQADQEIAKGETLSFAEAFLN
ncbi:prevent-host-death protein [Candidatus Peregrinibacteria bacterium]|nr:MAG: prevent-host-death protein [Candidatus Peregrinibacteria bacterium]